MTDPQARAPDGHTKDCRLRIGGSECSCCPDPRIANHITTALDLREMADDCERFNDTPPIEAEQFQRLYLRITRYAPRYLREAAQQLEAMAAPLMRIDAEGHVEPVLPRLEYNEHCGACARNKITLQVFGPSAQADARYVRVTSDAAQEARACLYANQLSDRLETGAMSEPGNILCAYCGEYMPPGDRWPANPSFCPKLTKEQLGDWLGCVNLHKACADARDWDIDAYFAQAAKHHP